MNLKEILNKFKIKLNVKILLSTLIIILVLLGNFFLSVFNQNKPLNWDLTPNKAFTLSQDSKDFLTKLEIPIEIILLNKESEFAGVNEYFAQANTVLKQYCEYNKNIKIKYIDLNKDPTFISRYPAENLNTNSVIVKSENKYRIISAKDLFDIEYSYYGSKISASKAEQELTSAILYVSSKDQIKIGFIRGFGEKDSAEFINILKKNNFEIKEISLLTDQIPQDLNTVIICGPERDYSPENIEKLEKFLEIGEKNLVYFADPNLSIANNLENFLKRYDVTFKSGVVYETNPQKLVSNKNLFYAICEYKENIINQNLKNQNIPVLMPYSRPIYSEHGKILLEFSEKAGIIPVNPPENFDFSNINGPIACAVLSENKSNKIAVIGSCLSVSDKFVNENSLNNSAFFVSLLNNITNRQDMGIIIESKTILNESLGIDAMSANLFGLIFIVILPILILAIGLVVFLKRRKK